MNKRIFALTAIAVLLMPAAALAQTLTSTAEKWNEWFAPNGSVALTGDFDGDRRTDILTVGSGNAYVSLSDSNEFVGIGNVWSSSVAATGVYATGDANGDGRDDLIRFSHDSNADVFVFLSTGTQFGAPTLWNGWFSLANETPFVGDFSGDGRVDIATYVPSSGVLYVATSNGVSFASSSQWITGIPSSVRLVSADVDGDGDDDIVRFMTNSSRDVFVHLSSRTGFYSPSVVNGDFSRSSFTQGLLTGDFTGDGRDDLIRVQSNGQVFGSASTASGTAPETLLADQVSNGGRLLIGDPDGDQFDDYIRIANDATGDVWVTRCNPFERGFMSAGSSHAGGEQRLMTFMMTTNGQSMAHSSFAYAFAMVNFANYIEAQSGGALDLILEPIQGPFAVQAPFSSATLTGVIQSGVFSAAQSGTDFTSYDSDGNGVLDQSELALSVFDTNSVNNGVTVGIGCMGSLPNHPGGFQVCPGRVSFTGHQSSFEGLAHEFSHLLGTGDVYGSSCNSDDLTVMSCSSGSPDFTASTSVQHLDIWHKMALGWVHPRVYPLNGETAEFTISATQSNGGPSDSERPVLLYDPTLGVNDYFIIEARDASTTWDDGLGAEGIVVWQVQVDSQSHMPTNGVDPNMMDLSPAGSLGSTTAWALSDTGILSLPGSVYMPDLSVVAGVAGDNSLVVRLEHDTCHTEALGGLSYCGLGCPCAEGQGDCDTDNHCATGLSCVQNNGAQFGFAANLDVCVRTCHQYATAGSSSYCTPSCPCGEEIGDCDTNADCAEGLVCFQQAGVDVCRSPY
ncbi:MAG: FG-GAP-like repeat-containing protein [Polyangiales bacterium]